MAGEFHISGFAIQREATNSGPEVKSPLTGLTGKFISNVPEGKPIGIDGGLFYIPARSFIIGNDGLFYETLPDGATSTTPGLNLTADDPAFGLLVPLQWQYTPDAFAIGGRLIDLEPFWFDAMAPGWTGTLDELTPVPGIEQPGGTRGIRGYSFVGLESAGGGSAIQALVDSPTGPIPAGDPVTLPGWTPTFYATNIGNGTNTTYTLTHGLGTQDVVVELWRNETGKTVNADIVRSGVNTVAIIFADPPATNAIRVLISAARFGLLGDGLTPSVLGEALLEAGTGSVARSAINAEYTGNKGAANGYAPLNGSAKIDVSTYLPTVATLSGAETLTNKTFVSARASTATGAGTTTLSITDAPVQVFTGTSTQTVKLPTTGVVAGQVYSIINNSTGLVSVQSSAANLIFAVGASITMRFIAVVDTPTAAADWQIISAKANAGNASYTTAMRDGAGWLNAGGFFPSSTSTATAAGTTALSSSSFEVQIFTGTTTQTCTLPSAGITAGRRYTIINTSTGSVTVNASGGATVATLLAGTSATFNAASTTPTTAAHWQVSTIQANGLEAATTTGAQTINNKIFIPGRASTATAAGTTTLTIADASVQVFTGTTTQTVKLPTTSVVAGQTYTVVNNSTGVATVQSSGANTIFAVGASKSMVFMAAVDTPTAAADWQVIGATGNQSNGGYTMAVRDSNGWLTAAGFHPSATSTATAAGTTALLSGSFEVQIFTGTTTQTCTLPTSSVTAGHQLTIINTSTGAVTVNASGGATVATLTTGQSGIFIALQSTPTLATHWQKVA